MSAWGSGSSDSCRPRQDGSQDRPKRRSNRKRQKTESGSSGHSTAGVARRPQAPDPKPEVSQFKPRTPIPGGEEDSSEDSSISGRDEEDLASGSTKDTDREAQKPHEPQSPSHTEFGTAIPQEHGDRSREEAIPREEPDSQGVRSGECRYLVEPEKEKGSRRSPPREAGGKERPEEVPGARREGQYEPPAERARPSHDQRQKKESGRLGHTTVGGARRTHAPTKVPQSKP